MYALDSTRLIDKDALVYQPHRLQLSGCMEGLQESFDAQSLGSDAEALLHDVPFFGPGQDIESEVVGIL
ncbi:hypothetical protein CEE59_08640 [Stenotrophomonas maltophilia]|nr:hypothetical protein CEE59_08640 [Stenotrophomonas maltophilia]PZS84493.1 hypothetical protein A7X74_05975 [Stenotrophomonas maltophilia]